MTSIIMLHKRWQNIDVFTHKMRFQVILMSYNKLETNIHAPVLLNLLNLLRKSDKMIGKPHILSLFSNLFNKFNKT